MEEKIIRKSVVLYEDLRRMLKYLDDEQTAKLIRAIFNYAYDQIEPDFDNPMLSMAFEPVRTQLDRDWEKYVKRVRANRKNGEKGGRPPKDEADSGEDP